MSEYGDLVKAKCDAFADRVVKLNDYLLDQAANKKPEVLKKKADGKPVFKKPIPVYLQSIASISNQLLRSGTSIGANNAEATNEARESLYWIELLHRNKYRDDKEIESIHGDCEELVRILVSRCKKLDDDSSK